MRFLIDLDLRELESETNDPPLNFFAGESISMGQGSDDGGGGEYDLPGISRQ